jgi:DNA repair protein SbcD/Mre11
MRIAHLADVHLGYRAYARTDRDGVNQRERDVAEALGRVVDQVIDAEPELVVVAGDLFHSGRPSNAAIMEAFRQFTRLRRGLPDAPVVLVAGLHDAPRSADSGSILRLLAEVPDVHVADRGPRAFHIASHDLRVECLPHPGGLEGWVPGPRAGTNVLVAHGALAGSDFEEAPWGAYGRAGLDLDALRLEAWDYVALGGHHDPLRLAPNAWYAGATERTTPDVWSEADSPRGWVLYATEGPGGEHRAIATRPVVELPELWAGEAGPDGGGGDDPAGRVAWARDLDGRIHAAAAALEGGVTGKVVRQVIRDVPRDLFRRLDHDRIRSLRSEALHYQLEARRPDPARRAGGGGTRPRTLEEELATFLAERPPESPGVDRDRLLALGTAYLAEPDSEPEAPG